MVADQRNPSRLTEQVLGEPRRVVVEVHNVYDHSGGDTGESLLTLPTSVVDSVQVETVVHSNRLEIEHRTVDGKKR